MACELLSCKLWHGYDAQLLHHAKLIKDAPTLGNLSIHKSVYDYPGDSGGLASCWDAHQFTLMGTICCPARHDLIPFGDLFINRETNVWEGVAVHCDELFGTFWASRQPGKTAWATVDVVLGDNLI